MARREQREEASRRRRQEAEASQARLLSARLSETHSPRDLERMVWYRYRFIKNSYSSL